MHSNLSRKLCVYDNETRLSHVAEIERGRLANTQASRILPYVTYIVSYSKNFEIRYTCISLVFNTVFFF